MKLKERTKRMTNEIVVPEIKFEVAYEPSTIEIKNEDYLKQLVDEIVEKYSVLVFTEDNISEAKKTRSELNNYRKLLDDQRKAVKKEYNEPLKGFEKKIKAYVKQIDSVNDEIKDGIADYELAQTQIRKQKINDLITEMLITHELTENDIQSLDIDKSLFTQTAFTKKGEPTKKTIEAIHNKLGYISLEKKRIFEAKNTVKEFAEISGLDPYAWEELIDKGLSSSGVIEAIKQAVEKKEAVKAEQERLRIAKEEYDAAIQKSEEEKQATVHDVVINTETGEVIKSPNEDEVLTFTLKVSAQTSKLFLLKKYMKEQGITYKNVNRN